VPLMGAINLHCSRLLRNLERFVAAKAAKIKVLVDVKGFISFTRIRLLLTC